MSETTLQTPEPAKPAPRPRNSGLTPRQELLAQFIAQGELKNDAYRKAYKKPHALPATASNACSRILAQSPQIMDRVAQLQGKLELKTLLTVNERLAIAAKIAQEPGATRSDKLKAIEVYGKLAGDHAPERIIQETTIKGDANAPVVTRLMSKAEKIAMMRKMREARRAQHAAQQSPGAAA